MRTRTLFVALFLILLAARLCHVDILWAEEDLPMAAAEQMHFGKTLYRGACCWHVRLRCYYWACR